MNGTRTFFFFFKLSPVNNQERTRSAILSHMIFCRCRSIIFFFLQQGEVWWSFFFALVAIMNHVFCIPLRRLFISSCTSVTRGNCSSELIKPIVNRVWILCALVLTPSLVKPLSQMDPSTVANCKCVFVCSWIKLGKIALFFLRILVMLQRERFTPSLTRKLMNSSNWQTMNGTWLSPTAVPLDTWWTSSIFCVPLSRSSLIFRWVWWISL